MTVQCPSLRYRRSWPSEWGRAGGPNDIQEAPPDVSLTCRMASNESDYSMNIQTTEVTEPASDSEKRTLNYVYLYMCTVFLWVHLSKVGFFAFSSPELISRRTQKQDEQTQKIAITAPPSFFSSRVTISRVLFSIGYRTRRIGLNTFLKAGRRIDITEAETM